MFEKYLQDIGLSGKEATIYLSLLQVDNASVLELSKKTTIKRPTVYVILNSLSKKGLVSQTTVGKKTKYIAEPPERLETFFQRRKQLLEEYARRAPEIITELKSIDREAGERPIVKFFEGRDGIISMSEEIFSRAEKSTAYLIYPRDLVEQFFTEAERKKYRERRLKKNISAKVIYTYDKDSLPSDNTGERIKVDKQIYPITCDILIIDNIVKIAILGKKLSGILIESEDFATTFRSIFNLAFNNIKKTQQ